MGIKKRLAYWLYPFITTLEERLKYSNTRNNILGEAVVSLESAFYKKTEEANRYHDLLVDKNAECSQAQRIYVTDHAVHQYISRVPKARQKDLGSQEDIRQKIYKLVVRHLLVTDKLTDGSYDIDRNMVARIKDNTVVTCLPRRGRKNLSK